MARRVLVSAVFLLPVLQPTVDSAPNSGLIFSTRRNIDNYLYDMEQQFRADLNREFIEKYSRRKRDAGMPEYNLVGLDEGLRTSDREVSATDFFTYGGETYAVVSVKMLSDCYIARVRRNETSGSVDVLQLASFSVQSFVDPQYNATFQQALQKRVVEIKAYSFHNKVFIMTALEDSFTLLFLVVDPDTSWTPKYQDSVLNENEVASDFAFFEEADQLRVVVTVNHIRVDGVFTTARQSYIYMLSGGIKFLQTHTVPTPDGATSVTTFTDKHWTYIVIGQNSAQSLVYRHQASSQSLELFQYLPSSRAVSVQAFEHNTQTYVLLVNRRGDPTLFWWTSDQLFVWQSLELGGDSAADVISGHVIAFQDDTNFICVVRGATLYFFTTFGSYTGHFTLVLQRNYGPTAVVRSIHVTHVVVNSVHYYYLMVSAKIGSQLQWIVHNIDIQKTVVVARPPVEDPLLLCLDQLETSLDRLETEVDHLLALAGTVFVQEGTQNVTAEVRVEGALVVHGPADVQELSVNTNISGVFEPLDISALQNEITLCNASIGQLDVELRSALTRSTDQTITGRYEFRSLQTEGSLYVRDAARLDTLNDIPFWRLVNSTLTFSGTQTLQHELTLGTGTISELHLHPGATINGIRADDLMYVSGDQTVTGHHRYKQLGVNGDLRVTSTFNDLDLGSLVKLGETLSVSELVSLETADILDLRITNINGVNFAAWLDDVIRLDRPHSFTGQYIIDTATFSSLEVNQLNEHQLTAFLHSLWKSGNDAVAGTTTFTTSPSISDLRVSTVNGVRLDTDVLTTDTDQTVSAHVRTDRLRVSGHLTAVRTNGLRLESEVVRTSGLPNTVQGSVTFTRDVMVSGDVILPALATINGLDISEIEESMSNMTTLHFPRDVTIDGSWDVRGDVRIASLNGYNLSRLHETFWTLTSEQVIEVPVVITNQLVIGGDLITNSINGISTDRFIDINAGGTIEQQILFTGNVTASDIVLPDGGTVNGVDMSEFAETVVTVTGHQVISGVKTFTQPVQMSNVSVETINGLSIPSDIVLTDQNSTQYGSLTFVRDVEVLGSLTSSGDIVVTGAVNGYDVAAVVANLSNVFVNRTTNHVLFISGNVSFHALNILQTLNGDDVIDLLESVLYLDQDTYISDNFTVHGDVFFSSDQLHLSTVNQQDWSTYLGSLVLSDVGGTVSGTTTLHGALTVQPPGRLLVSELNGLTLEEINTMYLTLDSEQTIEEHVTVNGTIYTDSLEGVEMINSVTLEDVFYVNQDIHFYQDVNILSNVLITDLTLPGDTLDGCNLTKIFTEGLRKTGSQVLLGSTTIDQLNVHGDVTLGSADVRDQLVALLDRPVTSSGQQVISGHVTFASGLSVRSVHIAEYNGHSLSDFFTNALTTDTQTITLTQPVTLRGAVTFRDLTVTSDVTVDLVNGYDLSEWAETLVLRNQSDVVLLGPLVAPSLHVNHLLAMQTINGEQSDFVAQSDVINATVYFDGGLTVVDDLSVTGLVDGVDIDRFLDSTVNLVQDQVIHSNIVFNGRVTIFFDLQVPQINDVTFTDLVLNNQLTGVQRISGRKHFQALWISDGGGVCGLVHGVNLTEFCQSLVSRLDVGTAQTVTGHLHFQYPPVNTGLDFDPGLAEVERYVQLLLEAKSNLTAWIADAGTTLEMITMNVTDLLVTPDYSVDMAYLLLVQRLTLRHAASVQAVLRGTPSVFVLVRSGEDCPLGVGCLCRSTLAYTVGEGGRLEPSDTGSGPGQTWSFYLQQRRLVFTVHTVSNSYSSRCRVAETPSLTVSSSAPDRPDLLPVTYSVPHWAEGHVSAAQVFSFADRVYMLLGYSYAPGVLGLGGFPASELFVLENSTWVVIQSLPGYSVTSAQVTLVNALPHILIVNRFTREMLSVQGEIQIWEWSPDIDQFVELEVLYHADIQSVLFLHAHDKVYVAIADLDGLTMLEYVPEVHHYTVSQYLAEDGITSMTSFVIGAESYLMVFSAKVSEIIVYQVTHEEGLERHCYYPAAAVRSMAVFLRQFRLYAAVVHDQGLVVYHIVVRGRLSLAANSAAELPLLN